MAVAGNRNENESLKRKQKLSEFNFCLAIE